MTTTTGIPAATEDAARYFELDADFPPDLSCPDCGEYIYTSGLVNTDRQFAMGTGALTLGDLWDAANAHVCTEEDDDE